MTMLKVYLVRNGGLGMTNIKDLYGAAEAAPLQNILLSLLKTHPSKRSLGGAPVQREESVFVQVKTADPSLRS
jgi:hypothetical protein